MFYLHVSNRTENLLRHMAEVMRADKQPDFFAKELFLIQSQGMERMIAQTLADEFGSFCNFKFFLPLDFLGFIADRLGMGISPDGFQRQILTWRIDGLLRKLSGEVYLPIVRYLSGENSELKRFQLSRRLANIFDQYQVMRPDMLLKWEGGVLATTHPAESWQMDLWQRLLAQPCGDVHRGMQFSQVIERLNGNEDLAGMLTKRIFVIGLHTLPPIFLNYLNSLSSHMDVHFLLLSPCRNYWGNIESQRAQLKRNTLKASANITPDIEEHHPLLAVLGRQGRDLQNMMLDGASFALEFASYDDPLDGHSSTDASLLCRLQADLLEGRIPGGQPSKRGVPEDKSIQIVSCHSKLREMTVLKDHLLHFLHLDPSLELRDIVVMAPDIQEYAPLIPAVFQDIQHSIADRSMRRRNSIIASFLRFLDLLTGRFNWRETLDLLRQPTIFPQFQLSLSDLDILQQWVIDTGIRWGLSGRQRSEAGLSGFDETSWKAGLDRMLMGYAIEAEEFIDGVLPFGDIEGRVGGALGGLCRFIELVEEAQEDFQRDRSVGDWSETLLAFVQQLFGDDNEPELVELRTIIAELSEAISPFHTDNVGFKVIREWFNQSAKESRSSTGFLRGQLTFCSMLPMRSIPFKVVCLVGLCDGVFPKNDTHDTFDLMATACRAGDRSPRADDRYQFLEALLAARSHLYLSYIGQSIRTNEQIPPSVVVTELLEVLEDGYGSKDIVVHHPLHPFSRKYFVEGDRSRLFSYDGYFCKTAEILQRGVQPPAVWWQGDLDRKIESVSFNDLLRFYINPQKFFVKDCLGIHLAAGEDLPDDREMFELSGLDKYNIEEEMIRFGLAGKMAGLLKKVQAEGRWPLGTSGQLTFAEKQNEVESFIETVHQQQMGERLVDVPFDFTVGNYRLIGTMSNMYENGVMLVRYGKMRGRDLMMSWIHHQVLRRLVPAANTIIVALDMVIDFQPAVSGPDFDILLNHFDAGCRTPSAFYIEPALSYARQLTNTRAQKSPIETAIETLKKRLEYGYEPEWQLLLRGSDEDVELGEDFERLCQQIMCPVWSAAHE